MISQIHGTLREQRATSVLVDVQGITYEVLVPPAIMQALGHQATVNQPISLVTFHYYHMDGMSRSLPVLIGFMNEVEREFFERFITVSGVGPKAALKALTMPISMIAQGIDDGNLALLKSMPGIGEQRAKEIIAKLQGKVGKFGLIQDQSVAGKTAQGSAPASSLEEEAVAVLLQLQYKKSEAKDMVKRALARHPKVATAEELLNAVYHQRQSQPAEQTA